MANIDNFNPNSQLASQLANSARPQNGNASTGANSGNPLPPTAGSGANVQQAAALSAEQVEQVVAKLSDFAQSIQRDLAFSTNEATGDTVIVVKDRSTDEIIRQIPSEFLLELAQNLNELQEKLESSKGNLLEVRV